MSRFILLIGYLSLLTVGAIRTGWAQTILAGQVSGAIYTDLIPDKEIDSTGKITLPYTHLDLQDSLDLDGNGVADIKIWVHVNTVWTSGQSHQAYCQIYPLHDNVALPISAPIQYSSIAFNNALTKRMLNEAIQPVLGASGSMQQGQWNSGPSSSSTNSFNFTLTEGYSGYNSPHGFVHTGFWGDAQDGYLPVRVRATSNAQWRYGWIRLQVPSDTVFQNSRYIRVIIKDYAISNTALALQSAQAAGWQIYPTQVTDQLTLEPPASTVRGQVIVKDICGRPVAQDVLSGGRQQLNLAELASGVYLVQFYTPAGCFVQRITKQ